ncbi:MAG TPA: hypothetical protein VNE40_04680 [Candidatus Dormibacteraeota bacterium]|nr:hypothetical protein [Candidatus Dormibacteraeota bacterium]
MKQLDKWHRQKRGLAVFGLLELILAYGSASLAIDRGNLLWYVLTVILLVGGITNFGKLVGKIIDGYKTTKA